MKTKEEQNTLNRKDETRNRKLRELNEEELELVTGGVDPEETMPSDTEVERLRAQANEQLSNPIISKADKAILQSALTKLKGVGIENNTDPVELEKIISKLEKEYLPS